MSALHVQLSDLLGLSVLGLRVTVGEHHTGVCIEDSSAGVAVAKARQVHSGQRDACFVDFGDASTRDRAARWLAQKVCAANPFTTAPLFEHSTGPTWLLYSAWSTAWFYGHSETEHRGLGGRWNVLGLAAVDLDDRQHLSDGSKYRDAHALAVVCRHIGEAAVTQRWRHQRDSYRPAGEPIDPSRYGVEVLPDDRTARTFVREHHYSGSYPAARCRVGLYRMRQLVGVAVFSVPAQANAIRARTGTTEGVELGRFVLLDDVPANGETWFLRRAFAAMVGELPDVRAVLSYSDPLPRRRADGSTLTPGHIGTIYQAHNGRFVGQGKPERLWLDRDGRTVSRRGLSKLRNGERGHVHVYQRLLELGAPARNPGESGPAYVDRALLEGPFTSVRHPGCLAYVWPVGSGRKATEQRFPERLPYPRRAGDPRSHQLALGA